METMTKTAANIEVVKTGFTNFGQGNIAGILDACTEDVTWSSYENEKVPFSQTYRGKTGVAEFFKNLSESVDYTEFTPEEFYASGNKVFAKVYHEATVKATGKSFAHHSLMEFTIENEKILGFFAYVDTLDQAIAFTK
jgi:ketosteroid isomerase-like protein